MPMVLICSGRSSSATTQCIRIDCDITVLPMHHDFESPSFGVQIKRLHNVSNAWLQSNDNNRQNSSKDSGSMTKFS
ncbi:hypothetical protein DERP_013216 [Dermatophagoides pteronyssinus]|uniref:Uncharacterized protein n=1 Tax=Dermatophagoides pteronyssinus TaxID=6956 RepID=A0ABQ8IRP5_DERPT|nr:hypothetical protein DERP_013216 [Dermatophagoides pteronyssinus]